MSATAVHERTSALEGLLKALSTTHPEIEVRPSGAATAPYAHDASIRETVPGDLGPAVALPDTAAQVQALVAAAAAAEVSVVPRGAGTGLSGGASARPDQLVISTERLTRIIEISPEDEVAVVEPGVLNADLNRALRPLGLFYAPDPASHEIASIGGNIATNAGGLHCAKYGVTQESVLELEVVLPDGSLIRTGHRSIKGVTGLDLTSLFTGSEGILGIVVAATLKIRPIPVAVTTVTAYFDNTLSGAEALSAIRRTRVRPAALEFLDSGTLASIDYASGTDLLSRGGALLLIELDGYGIREQAAELRVALEAAGGRVTEEDPEAAERLWELRRSGRGFDPNAWFLGGDIAVPVSRIPDVYAALPEIGARYGVETAAVAHAGDGNLHPVVTKPIPDGADPATPPAELHDALDELVRLALSLGGTVSGEHGIGSVKRDFAELELSPRNLALQHAIKDAVDPSGLFNPGKAI